MSNTTLTPEMNKCLNALLLELPESIVNDVRGRIIDFGNQLYKEGKAETQAWIPVKGNKPDDYDLVFVYANKWVRYGYYVKGSGWFDEDHEKIRAVTHYQEIIEPFPPKEQ